MNKQQVIAFMDWVESFVDLRISEELERGSFHEGKHEEKLRDELLNLFGFGEGMK